MARDSKHKEKIDQFTDEVVKALEGQKAFDKEYEKSGKSEQFRNIEYVEREEDPEIKEIFEKENRRFQNLAKDLYGKIDGELDMDLHGNITHRAKGQKQGEVDGLTDSGTYILRDGKLVKGKAEVREQASFSNWYCANADPEDIRKHREMMDRMSYRGP